MFVSLPFEEFLRGVFLYLVSHVPRVWPRARYLFLLSLPPSPSPSVREESERYIARYSRLELTLYNTFVIRIDECASPSRALLHLGERWPTIEGASGCSPFSLARHDSSSDPPGLTNTTLNLPCVRSLTVKASCIARGDTCPPLLSLFHIHFLFLPILPSLLLELFATYLFEKDLI